MKIRIDADTHFTPFDAYDEVPPRYREIGPHYVKLDNGRYRMTYQARQPFIPPHIRALRQGATDPQLFDVEKRTRDMAEDGFAMQVLIPNNSPFYYDVPGDLGASVSRSFNRAIGRILKTCPGKFIGIATAPLQDVRLAITEMEYAVTELGLSAVIIYQNINGRDLDSNFLWPFYQRAEELGVPLVVHGVDSGPLLGVERYARFNLDVCLGFPYEVFLAISTLILGGVVERFPKLRFGFFEVGVGFIPWLIDRLETTYDARPAARAKTAVRPKDGFKNFYFSTGADDSTLPDVIRRLGSGQIMIGSDYPHPDGTFPKTLNMVEAIEGLTEKDKDSLLGDTAARFFNVNL